MLPFPGRLALGILGRRLPSLVESCARNTGAREIVDCGPVFLPVGNCLSLPVIRKNIPSEGGPAQKMAVCCFALSLLAPDKRQELFAGLRDCAGCTLFLDFRLPERNLEWPACLLITPLRHAASHGRLEAEGGVEGVLYKERARFAVLARHVLRGGAMCAVLVRNLSAC